MDMNAKKFYNILVILLGYGLVIGGFIVFGESLETRIKILDIVVSCLIFTQFVQFTLFPLVDLGKSAHKEVGMMGIHFATLNICCTLSLALMVCGIIYQIPFNYQLMGHLIILFMLIVGRVATLHSGDKVQQIYEKEQHVLSGKLSLRNAMDDFMDEVASVKNLAENDRKRLEKIHEAVRFITPSANLEAKKFDDQIILAIDDLTIMMRNVTLNKVKISEQIEHLERVLLRRKKY